ncbi:MAG: hypothetical protein RLZZ528_2258 [Pseudomonadota bacterium]
MTESVAALVIGAGPAGLMAAEELSRAGHAVVIAEAKPSPARKFLMAGKSGLNITRAGTAADIARACGRNWLGPAILGFGPDQVVGWMQGLGIDSFTGSTGRVFPTGMKASPLLRAWLRRLDAQGVTLRTRWRWTGWQGAALAFDTPVGQRRLTAGVTVLALGGASWERLGSDAAWVPWLQDRGVTVAPFRPANVGFRVDWSAHMAAHLGKAVKNVALTAGGATHRGEFVLSQRGIEGGGVYAVSAPVRDGADLTLDLLPDLTEAEIAQRLMRARPGESLANALRKALGLPPEKIALLQEWGRPLPAGAALAARLKALPVRHAGPRPIDEAISTAGGIAGDSLTPDLELRALPGVFAAGEMLDWEAPTGGYLLTACLATGRWAGLAAARRLSAAGPSR